MLRLAFALIVSLPLMQTWPQPFDSMKVRQIKFSSAEGGELPDAPSAGLRKPVASKWVVERETYGEMPGDVDSQLPLPAPRSSAEEPYHWKGLLLQSFGFIMLEDAVRVITSDQHDRHILLNKPFWSDYWASLQQWNMHRWNDGDSIPVNYIGHPMQGAISGYIQIQNDPRGRDLKISRDSRYWKSRGRAFLWATVFSVQQKIGPFGEAAVFNAGGFTYPIGCPPHDLPCQKTDTRYTNNTGWVDFINTPIIGTLWLLGEDTLDRYVSDPLIERHPNAFGYKVLRSGLNPTRSLANMLRGTYPWYRDYEHPSKYELLAEKKLEQGVGNERVERDERVERFDVSPNVSFLNVATNTDECVACRKTTTTGPGMEMGWRVWSHLDVVANLGTQGEVSPVPSPNIGGSLLLANFGVRSGYSKKRYAVKMTLAPGFASYSKTQSSPGAPTGRIFNFSTVLAASGDIRLSPHLALRATAQEMLIRYKSSHRDPPGIGQAPWLSFLSHDNYINSMNWGARFGPVFRF